MSKGIGLEFMQKTQYKHMEPSLQSQGVTQPPLELPAPEGAAIIPLPAPKELALEPFDLRALIEKRRTLRNYSEQALTLAELSYLLWCTQGVQKVTTRPATARTVPSAGARHAFETYLLVNRVEGLAPGLYRYLAIEHKLALVEESPDLPERLAHACQNQPHVANSAVTFFWVAVKARMYWRYGERGYRYLHLDAGHVCQNLCLAAEALRCGVCPIAAFNDDRLNEALGADGEEQFALYAASLGKRL